MRSKLSLLAVTLLVVAFGAIPIQANDLTLFGGVQNPGNLTLRTATGSLVTNGPRTFGTFGLRLVIGGRIFGSEHTLARSPNFLSSQHSAIIYNSNILLQAPLSVVRPYATVGLGVIWVRGSGLQGVTGSKFAINYGGGLKIKLAGPLGAQVDARGYTATGVDAQRLNVLETSVGIVLSF